MIAPGSPILIVNIKAMRYISLNARSVTMQFMLKHPCSWSEHKKCFGVATIPFSWIPMHMYPARVPARRGSSPSASCPRPASGDRGIFTQGARSTCVPFAIHSSANNPPTSRSSSLFHEAANAGPAGRHIVGVELKKRVPRTVFGPSLVLKEGIPRRGMGTVCAKSSPAAW